MTAPRDPDLERGIEHFNRGEYFEAHEAWEALWLRERGPLADFYKGLIQCAAALLHVRRGNWAGARRLHGRGRALLARCAPETLGVPVAELVAAMDALFDRAPDTTAARAPSRMPRIARPPSRS